MSCRKSTVIATTTLTLLVSPVSFAAVDYARDIQPLFEKHCYECHGPKKQKNGFRLDRRSRAFQGVMRANILPGSSAGSRVYRRVVDSQFGLQMPPEEVLAPEQIGLIRQWIDEGAHWPDELANEVEPPPPDPAALAMIERILGARNGGEQRRQLVESFAGESQALNARGPDGATPLMYVALHGDADMLRAALAAGGNPNHANDAGATALIWAVQDAEKVRLLLEAGANPNVASVFGRTPLWLAALSRNDSTLDLLLARGRKGQG
jgi:mono/diheme cytochrome c family protein